MCDIVPPSGEVFIPFMPVETAVEETRLFLENRLVSLDKTNTIPLNPEKIWNPAEPRAAGRMAHGWFFARAWYSAVSLLQPDEIALLVKRMEEIFLIWKPLSLHPDSMAYHDETTAQRAMVFIALLRAYKTHMPADFKETFQNELENDLKLLQSDSFYAGLNNHGMFQDIALLVAADYGYAGENKSAFEDLAFTRLHNYFIQTFTTDGIHKENTPTYHVMVSRYLAKIIEYAARQGYAHLFQDLQGLMSKADEYAAFCVTPFKKFPPISDTNLSLLTPQVARTAFPSGKFLGAITNGVEGELPEDKIFVAEDSGYAIGRTGWDSSQDSYLFFSAAYNADYHKHSDELSIYLAAEGYELLAEAGPNGYQYSDRFTKFAFSGNAHNTMLVDDEGLPRTDQKSHLTTLTTNRLTDASLDVTGKTARFSGVDWSRRVIADFTDGDGPLLTVSDKVTAETAHSYTFLWHLGPKIIPLVRGNFVEFFSSDTDKKLAEMQWEGDPPLTVREFHGHRHPRIQGWKFPSMGTKQPGYTIEVEFEGEKTEVTWTLRTRDFKLLDRGVLPQGSIWQTFAAEKPVHYLLENPSGRIESKLAIVFSAVHPIGDFTFNYRSSLRNFGGYILYILDDFGDQGAYYLASNRNLAEFRSVQGLIKSVITDLGISPKDVFSLGSSKGGTSALIHGVSAGIGEVYSGAPQYQIGNFLKNPHPNILRYLSGGTTANDIFWSNRIVKDLLASGVRSTRIHVVVGLKDAHYRHHAIPLVDDSRSLGYQTELLTVPGAPHSSFGSVFRDFVRSLSNQKSLDSEFTLPHTSSFDPESSEYGVTVVLPRGAKALGQLYRNRDKVGSIKVFKGNSVRWNIKEQGLYRVRIYVDLPNDPERKAFGTKPHSCVFASV